MNSKPGWIQYQIDEYIMTNIDGPRDGQIDKQFQNKIVLKQKAKQMNSNPGCMLIIIDR